MSKKQYRIVAALAVCALLITTMTACHEEKGPTGTSTVSMEETMAHPTEVAALQEAKNAFQTDWENFLAISEEFNSRVLWALDYAAAFAQDSTWDNLLKVCAASSAAKQELQLLELPERTLTEDQYFLLMDAGIEADVLLLEYENLPLLRSVNLETLSLLEKIVTFEMFFSAVTDGFPDWIENAQKRVWLDNEYLCITTNYLLLQLGDDALWQALNVKYPMIGSACGEWSNDSEQLMQNCKTVLWQTEKTELILEDYAGILQYTKSIVDEAVTTGNLDRLAAQMNKISGIPAYFPRPEWIPMETPQYYLITDVQSRELRLVAVGEEISDTPAACYIICSGISREDVENYGEVLKMYGLDPYSKWNDETQTYQILATDGESRMTVQWTEGETIIYLDGTVGCLIPELYLQAIVWTTIP